MKKQTQIRPLKFGQSRMVHRLAVLMLTLLIFTFALTALAQEGEPAPLPTPDSPDLSKSGIVIRSRTETPAGVNVVVEIPVAQDTYSSSANPNTNYGSSSTIRFGHSLVAGALRPLLQFNLGSIPAGVTINSAQFQIYLYSAGPSNDPPMSYVARHLVSSWNEGLVTWNSHQPEWGSIFGQGQATSNIGWQAGDVTALVRDWYTGAHANNGFTAIGNENPSQEHQRYYWSRNANNGLYPRLIVNYTIPPPDNIPPFASVHPLPAWSPASFPVSWSGEDNPGGSGIAYYDVQYNANGGAWIDWVMRTTSTSAQWQGGLNNTVYQFRARAVDKANNVQDWTGVQAQTRVDSVPPSVSMVPLPEFTTEPSFTIAWSGSDSGSGIASYDVQFRLNGSPWQTLLQSTSQTSFIVTGLTTGDFVELRARGRDQAGNVQPWSADPQTSTTVWLEPISLVQPFDPLVIQPTDTITSGMNVTRTVEWRYWTPNDIPVSGFELRYRFRPQGTPTFGPWTPVPVSPGIVLSTEFVATAANGDGQYQFEVRALSTLPGRDEPWNGSAEAFFFIDLDPPFITTRAHYPLMFQDDNAVR